MRTLILSSFVLGALACVAGCDGLAFGGSPVITEWKSRGANMGLVLSQSGNTWEGEMFLLDDLDFAEGFGGDSECFNKAMILARGVVDAENNVMLFPLQTVNAVQANSAALLRKNGKPYVEIPLDTSGEEIVGRWRDGDKKPKFERSFARCSAGAPAE